MNKYFDTTNYVVKVSYLYHDSEGSDKSYEFEHATYETALRDYFEQVEKSSRFVAGLLDVNKAFIQISRVSYNTPQILKTFTATSFNF